MQLINKSSSRGDTLVEVLFSITIFSLIAVGSLSIMNQGSATAQRSLEITLAKQQVDAQAETLRFMNSSYISAFSTGNTSTGVAKEWQTMVNYIDLDNRSDASDFSNNSSCSVLMSNLGTRNYFVLNAKKATLVDESTGKIGLAKTFSQVNYNPSSDITSADGIWIEAIHSKPSLINPNNQTNTDYLDFHIRACWDSPGQSAPVKLGTIVRLYEPTK